MRALRTNFTLTLSATVSSKREKKTKFAFLREDLTKPKVNGHL